MPLQFAAYSTTRKLFPDTEPGGEKQIHLYGAENEVLSFQIAVRSDKAATVAVSGEGGAEIFEQLYISTPRKAAWGFPQPLPCYPDALRKTESISLTPGRTTALWVRVQSSCMIRVGDQQVQVTVTRWPWELPRRPSLKTSIGLGGAGFARHYGVALFSPGYWARYKQYYDMLLDYRLSAYHLPFANVNDPAAKSYMQDERVTTFRAEGLNAASWQYIKPTGKAWIYNFDEPTTAEEYAEVKSNAQGYHKLYKGIKYGIPFYTGAPGIDIYSHLKGAVNLWIPQTDYYAATKARAKARQAAGDELWLYTSWAPRAGWCNLMINQTALEHRLLFWQLFAEDVTGYLYWHSTFWDWINDPWKDQATVQRSDPGIYGDGSLFYPLPEGGSPSLRLELVREGLQDYELLQRAVSILGRPAVEGYVKRLTASLTNYTNNPALFEAVRMELGKAVAAKLEPTVAGPFSPELNEEKGSDIMAATPVEYYLSKKWRVTSPYGYRTHPITGVQESFHYGVDFGIPLGGPLNAPVPTPFAGTVTAIGEYGGRGKVVVVRIESMNVVQLFQHLHAYSCKVGDRLRAGDIVGLCGSTGNSTAIHLHYELRYAVSSANWGDVWGDPAKFSVKEEPKSQKFVAGDMVIVTSTLRLNVRKEPGGAIATQLDPGAVREILAHVDSGIWASGYYWWKVKEGWVAETWLAIFEQPEPEPEPEPESPVVEEPELKPEPEPETGEPVIDEPDPDLPVETEPKEPSGPELPTEPASDPLPTGLLDLLRRLFEMLRKLFGE